MTEQDQRPHHKIRFLRAIGGFLDGQSFEFSPGLNCIIGARGTGKTTILEFCRYALGQVPDEQERRLDALVKANLGAGVIEVGIETRDGMQYKVTRSAGSPPEVFGPDGAPVEVSLRQGQVFSAHFYSQHQIEDIAVSPQMQVRLIDNFVATEISELESRIRSLVRDLDYNAAEVRNLQQELADLRESVAEFGGVSERIKSLQTDVADESEKLQREVVLKGLRDRELRAAENSALTLEAALERLDEMAGGLDNLQTRDSAAELEEAENATIVGRIDTVVARAAAAASKRLQPVREVIDRAQDEVTMLRRELADQQGTQEQRYRKLLERHESASAKAREGARLRARYNELLDLKRRLDARQADLDAKLGWRTEQLDSLSEYYDQLFNRRAEASVQITSALEPDIRVRVTQFGERGLYRKFLADCFRGSGKRYNALVARLEASVPPRELARMVVTEAIGELAAQLDVRDDQAAWIVGQLAASGRALELETLQLTDRPQVELLDGGAYKDASALSTGQKCTAILPILLLDSVSPLVIDQPEDNLDNAFIYDTVVRSIRRVKPGRQLILVTHNPNIPVLGDAETVFVTSSDGQHGRLKTSGSVEDVKTEIELILEGGPEAFLERKRRYGH